MDNTILRNAGEEVTPNARAERALELYRTHGHKITRQAPNLHRVPSSDGLRSYDVRYGEREECPCADQIYHPETACKHILSVGISVAKRRRSTLRNLAALEDQLRHELMPDAERQELRDRVIVLRRRLA